MAGDFSDKLGPAEDEGERKIVDTRFMAIVEEMGVGRIPRRRLAPWGEHLYSEAVGGIY